MQDLSNWLGQWQLEIREGGKLKEIVPLQHNLITDAGLNMFRDALKGDVTDCAIKYIALGNSATAPTDADTTLVAEQFRKAVTSLTVDAVTAGILYSTLYVADTEANTFKCEEIGWFAGAAASATVDTGILIARVLYSRQKAATESWTLQRTDTLSRG
jgi:hypothetical protein